MHRLLISLVFFSLFASSLQANAQAPLPESTEQGASGQDYLGSIGLRRIDTDVTYFDPSAPPPELDTDQQPENRPESRAERPDTSSPDWTTAMIAAAVLALIAFIALRFGGNISVSLKRDASNPVRQRSSKSMHAPAWASKLGTIDEIAQIEDRRKALILAAQKVLAANVATNGVLMQRSWTAREALRHIPAGQRGLELLRSVVMASERVQFGGRDVTEEEFRQHIASCRQLMGIAAS